VRGLAANAGMAAAQTAAATAPRRVLRVRRGITCLRYCCVPILWQKWDAHPIIFLLFAISISISTALPEMVSLRHETSLLLHKNAAEVKIWERIRKNCGRILVGLVLHFAEATCIYPELNMQIKNIKIKNFRLLRDVTLCLEKRTTLIVGRNNSGKTSLAELFRRLLSENSASFTLEDFSVAAHAGFMTALNLALAGEDSAKVRAALPVIEITITIFYDQNAASLGPLTDFIIDLDPTCTEAQIDIHYELDEGKIDVFLQTAELVAKVNEVDQKAVLLQAMKELVPKHFKCSLLATDPNDPTNQKPLEWPKLRTLIQGDLVAAQRGLDDTTHKDNDSLSKILGVLFANADADSADENDRNTVEELRAAVKDVQGSIDKSFNEQLTGLLPALDLFGYRLPDPKIRTETQLDVELLLKNHTKIRYSGEDGVHLPEGYNGLGTRNLIYILLKLFQAFKSFRSRSGEPGAHLIFIEEPEAHLHPQMQEVFIQKLNEMATLFSKEYGDNQPWPVQFVVTTHSPHMANKASFDAIRYFLSSPIKGSANSFSTRIKDLKERF
jgi:energy-coupling factor transporter ATP-binding protein EcfA2